LILILLEKVNNNSSPGENLKGETAGGEVSDKEKAEKEKQEKEDKKNEEKRLQRQAEIEEALKNGPYVYELFSILIHRGSAMGGHYYCYIRVCELRILFKVALSRFVSVREFTRFSIIIDITIII
jgi:hypothetical protein